MKISAIIHNAIFVILSTTITKSFCQETDQLEIISSKEMAFLEKLTKDLIDSSKVYPGQQISSRMGVNNTGGIVINPGGRNMYPSFWIRDYAMTLETGLVPVSEQKHMLFLTARTQCDQSWITKGESLVPLGSIADHILVNDSKPIYFPGTYSYEDQGTSGWGTLPPYCDQYFFIHMTYYYIKASQDLSVLYTDVNGKKLLDRLLIAFHVPPANGENHIVYATENIRGVDFGFRDAIEITGYLSYPTILKFKASLKLAELLDMVNREESGQYREIATIIKRNMHHVFMDKDGMLRASTGRSNQPDVWSTSLAVYYDALEEEYALRAFKALSEAYNSGTISYKGNIRHIPTTDDFDKETAWEVTTVNKNEYQNGAYWGTPTGWVCYAIHKTDRHSAIRLANEFINDLRENDYRKGKKYGAPYECFNQYGYKKNPLYLTTVSCPLISFKRLQLK